MRGRDVHQLDQRPVVVLATLAANATSYSASGPFTGSTTYDFGVYAIDPSADSAVSSSSVTTPAWPSSPRNLKAKVVSPSENNLSWDPSSGASGYTIQRMVVGSNTWITIGTIDDGSTSFDDTTALAGQSYVYDVEASNDFGDSLPSTSAYPHSSAGWEPESGFSEFELPPNDDGSSDEVDLGFAIVFGGQSYSSLWVNNNGNVTFDGPMSTYTPFDLTTSTTPIIAPFFADVDTRGSAGGTVTYGTDEVDGHPAFGVNWNAVGYYNQQDDLTDSFQLVIIDRSDLAPGAFQIEFNYDHIDWETGDASGGEGGVGGTSARAGFSDGTGPDGSWELDGSGVNGTFLDSNFETGLSYTSLRSDVPGQDEFVLVPDVVEDAANLAVDSGVPFTEVVARFNEPAHPDAGPGDFSATIDWGDGATSPGTVVEDGDNFDVQGTHTYDTTDRYEIQVVITADNSDMQETIDSSADATDPGFVVTNPGAQSNDEGDVISLQISASDSDDDALYYGAEGLPPGLVIDDDGLISGTISPGAADGGPYNVDVIAGDGTTSGDVSFTWDVSLPAGGPTVSVSSSDDETPDQVAAVQNQGPGTVGFTISRNSGDDSLPVYFQLSGDAVLGVDYSVSFGSATGYVDESSGQGYVVVPAGSASAPVMITSIADGSDDDQTVNLALMGANNEFGGVLGYQMPLSPPSQNFTVRKTAGTVSGTIQFNGSQPVRFAQVDVYQTFPFGLKEKIGTTYTDQSGDYTFSGSFSKNGTGINLYVYTSSNPNLPMQKIDVWSYYKDYYYTIQQPWTPTVGSPNLSVPLASITNGNDTGRAFWVYDAAITAALFEASIPGLAQGATGIDFPAVSIPKISIPTIGSITNPTSYTVIGTPHILEADYADSETVLHEYGHSVAQDNGFFVNRLISSGYLTHYLGSDMRAQWGWSLLLPTFAFSEGWADFYSVAAQYFANPNATNVQFDIYPAENDQIRGETDEIGVMQLLWDLAGGPNPTQTNFNVQLSYAGKTGFQALCALIVANKVTSVDELWQALLTTTSDVNTLTAYGAVFAAHGMAVNTLGMMIGGAANNAWTAGDPIPEFTWTIPNGVNTPTNKVAGPLFNEFEVTVYDGVPGQPYYEVETSGTLSTANGRLVITGSQASWIPSQQQWDNISQFGFQNLIFVVKSTDANPIDLASGISTNFKTGPYWTASQFPL